MSVIRAFLAVALLAGAAWGAAVDTVVVQMDALVASSAQLTLGVTSIHFPDMDPDTTPRIPAQQNPVSVTANGQAGKNKMVSLTVKAAGDLTSGSDTIASSNVTWTATGSGFLPGTLSKASPQSAGAWRGPGSRTGTFSYFLANSWAYKTGNYTATVTYTLTAP